jgi:HAD superfamily hydrolase (TIGR01509 family)
LIKAIFFDYDGVLTADKTGSLTTQRYLSQASGVEFSKIKAALAPHNDDLTLGRTTHAQIWPAICESVGRDLSIGLLLEAFESTPANAGMFALARALKAKCSVGIITDNKQDRIDHLKKHQDLASIFDIIVVSSEVGSSKEGRAIFEYAMRRLDLRPGECVFIDNSLDNLVAPAALGIKTIFFDDAKNDIDALVEALRLLGVVTPAGRGAMSPMSFQIRPALSTDLEAIERFDEFGGSREQEISDGTCLVATHQEVVIGYASYAPRGLLGQPLLGYLCVCPEFRRRGAATALVQAVQSVVQGRRLISSTEDWCVGTQRIFERLGWTEWFYAIDLGI